MTKISRFARNDDTRKSDISKSLSLSYFLFLSYFFLLYVIMFKIFSKKWNDYTGEEIVWK